MGSNQFRIEITFGISEKINYFKTFSQMKYYPYYIETFKKI